MGNAAVTHSWKPGIHFLFVLLRKVEACKSITSWPSNRAGANLESLIALSMSCRPYELLREPVYSGKWGFHTSEQLRYQQEIIASVDEFVWLASAIGKPLVTLVTLAALVTLAENKKIKSLQQLPFWSALLPQRSGLLLKIGLSEGDAPSILLASCWAQLCWNVCQFGTRKQEFV